MAVSPLSRAAPSAPLTPTRAARLRAPLFLLLAALLAFEGIGGIVIFVARLAWGSTPGETLHVLAGAALALAYAVYQWTHWIRVGALRGRLDWTLGLIAALVMALALASGFLLGVPWLRLRLAGDGSPVRYAAALSAFHNVSSMLVLSFVAAHLGAVLLRDARARAGRASED